MPSRYATYSGRGVLSYVGLAMSSSSIRAAIVNNLHNEGWGDGSDTVSVNSIDFYTISIEIRMRISCDYTANNATPGLQAALANTSDYLGIGIFDSVSLSLDDEEEGCSGIDVGLGYDPTGASGGIGITGGGGSHTVVTAIQPNGVPVVQQVPFGANPVKSDAINNFAKGLGLSVSALAMIGIALVVITTSRK